MTKISIIGAGNVGTTLAMRIAEAGLAHVTLLDIVEGVPGGKAMDLTDAAPIIGHDCLLTGTNNYEDIKNSDIVVITAGFPRTPGMSREELLAKNSSIVKEASKKTIKLCPDAIIIVVTNPLDAMTFLAYRESGFPMNRVIGMAGVLDTSRFTALLAQEANVSHQEIETFVIGSHGDTMVPVLSHTTIGGKPVHEVLPKEKIDEVVKRTKGRGAEIVSLLKKGSAYYAPSASVFSMVRAIINNTKEVMCVSCLLNGEYGMHDIFIGVPAKIGEHGIEAVVELDLDKHESSEFKRSADVIRETIKKI